MIVGRGMALAEAARAYMTSEPMARFRVNVTGARKRVARSHYRFRSLLGLMELC